jgi:Polyketide cyclase / dehydrase and lipid transport
MASIRKDILTRARPEDVWAALRDVGALHTRLVPGFVVDTKLDGDTRVVTFGNGIVAREPILEINDATKRVAWAAVGGRLTHYNSSAQVFAEPDGSSKVVWLADVLPHEAATAIDRMMTEGAKVMKDTLDRLAEEAHAGR